MLLDSKTIFSTFIFEKTNSGLMGRDFDFILKTTRRYGPLRRPTSSSCGGLRPSAGAFLALWAKKELLMLFWPIFGKFLVSNSNLGNY